MRLYIHWFVFEGIKNEFMCIGWFIVRVIVCVHQIMRNYNNERVLLSVLYTHCMFPLAIRGHEKFGTVLCDLPAINYV